ncbi:hypothetical protein GWK47_010549 [Chionoecetes opilio]|uniref:Uncharacterized protein n=1 Tax=Chionoecetes opilio TaxID=41210 RepID=A0A8J4XYG4_CHIOP|nr:hypothetical protein GWK47_010549 [Chionoecetes opilio]
MILRSVGPDVVSSASYPLNTPPGVPARFLALEVHLRRVDPLPACRHFLLTERTLRSAPWAKYLSFSRSVTDFTMAAQRVVSVPPHLRAQAVIEPYFILGMRILVKTPPYLRFLKLHPEWNGPFHSLSAF